MNAIFGKGTGMPDTMCRRTTKS